MGQVRAGLRVRLATSFAGILPQLWETPPGSYRPVSKATSFHDRNKINGNSFEKNLNFQYLLHCRLHWKNLNPISFRIYTILARKNFRLWTFFSFLTNVSYILKIFLLSFVPLIIKSADSTEIETITRYD